MFLNFNQASQPSAQFLDLDLSYSLIILFIMSSLFKFKKTWLICKDAGFQADAIIQTWECFFIKKQLNFTILLEPRAPVGVQVAAPFTAKTPVLKITPLVLWEVHTKKN